MSDTIILVMATIWSLFAMYLIVWKLKINKFHEQMEDAMDRAVEDYVKKIKSRSELALEEKATELIRDTLVEARVIDRRVELKFVKNEAE